LVGLRTFVLIDEAVFWKVFLQELKSVLHCNFFDSNHLAIWSKKLVLTDRTVFLEGIIAGVEISSALQLL